LAIYHLSIKIVSRGKGASAVAKSAYRAGEKIKNEYDGINHDYTRKRGVVHTEILLPENAPAEYQNRAVLWNAVEKIEKAKNSQLAREIEIALPVELTREQSVSLVREYVNHHFVNHGMCADICLHDEKKGNPHAHILLTMRPFNEDRTWGDKQKKEYVLDRNGEKQYDKKTKSYKCKSIPTTDWNEQTKAEEWREGWTKYCNDYLERHDHAERIDHKSYARQGKDQIPTIHLGVAASQMEKRGIRTERGDINREIEVSNQKLRELRARLFKLENWLKEETDNTEPPTLADVITHILERREQTGQPSRYSTINNLKAAAHLLSFLTSNNIFDMAGLEKKIISMHTEQSAILDELKPIDRRLKTLDEHIKQSGYIKEFSAINKQYQQQKPKDQPAFFEKHRRELTLYQAAERHIKGVLNGRDKILLPAWKAEREKLTADRNRLNQRYVTLKGEVKEVEKIHRNVYDILREETREAQRTRARDIDR